MSFFTQKVWEALALSLLCMLVAMGVAFGMAHIQLAKTQVLLAQCNQANAELRASIDVNNARFEDAAKAAAAAEKRGEAAKALAEDNGRSLRQLLAKLDSTPKVKMVSCNDAMPTVNAILKEVK